MRHTKVTLPATKTHNKRAVALVPQKHKAVHVEEMKIRRKMGEKQETRERRIRGTRMKGQMRSTTTQKEPDFKA
ncbi:hypothetical protein C2G38_2097965 [Gigaspora rosea]|uniref:Uncharacterized protein n=1 Tax=Gigaspora rosea TaxID=44941 RepID=A0A397UY02_9GLOM|nr:hypothetical protein C2G38_2097965 [Gigaspora rosea]